MSVETINPNWKQRVVTAVSQSVLVRDVCKETGMPSVAVVYRTTQEDAAFDAALNDARITGLEAGLARIEALPVTAGAKLARKTVNWQLRHLRRYRATLRKTAKRASAT